MSWTCCSVRSSGLAEHASRTFCCNRELLVLSCCVGLCGERGEAGANRSERGVGPAADNGDAVGPRLRGTGSVRSTGPVVVGRVGGGGAVVVGERLFPSVGGAVVVGESAGALEKRTDAVATDAPIPGTRRSAVEIHRPTFVRDKSLFVTRAPFFLSYNTTRACNMIIVHVHDMCEKCVNV